VLKRPELQMKDDLMSSLNDDLQGIERKVEEKKKRGRKPGPRKSTDASTSEQKKPLLL
jgi:hypothetical protein